MHCSNCGSYLAPGVRFCSGCGTAAADPEATQIVRAPREASVPERLAHDYKDDDPEQVIFTVRPTLIFIKLGYLLAVLGAVAVVFLLALIPVSPYISIPLALSLLLVPAYYHLKRNMVRYTLTDAKIEIDTGLIARTTRNIPLAKIQDVTVSASIPQRLLGFGDLMIDNASELGGTTVLHNISQPRHFADLLLRELRRTH
ncbi:MAG TPA: PH domain-containing protein [Pyrinomonadaceae bacterium]|nr:PH domain-containing protein [Pyrinomonadaceae bacterium]